MHILKRAGLILAVFTTTEIQALTRTWKGGSGTSVWTSRENWSPNGVPTEDDVLILDGAVTVDLSGLPHGYLPSGVTVVITNGATLYNSLDVCRMKGGSTVIVAAKGNVSDYWAMYDGTMRFQDGARWTAGDLELNGPNAFHFRIGPRGFTTLTPSVLRWDPAKKFTQQTWTVDMADYTGGPADILLMDCTRLGDVNMTAANFWTAATRTVTNPGIYTNSTILFDPVQAAFILRVSQVPVAPPVEDQTREGGLQQKTKRKISPATMTPGQRGATLPSPWQTQDIGNSPIPGEASFKAGSFTVSGSGKERIGGTADSFRYVYQKWTGDGTITVKLTDIPNKAVVHFDTYGVMFRQHLEEDAPMFSMVHCSYSSNAILRQERAQRAEESLKYGTPRKPPLWLRITRKGPIFIGSYSLDGESWTFQQSGALDLPQELYVGLCVSSQSDDIASTATFEQVTVTRDEPK